MKSLILIFWLFLFNFLFSQNWNIKTSFDGIVKDNDLSTGYSFFYDESIASRFLISVGGGDNETYGTNLFAGLKFFFSDKQRGFYLLHENGFVDWKLAVLPSIGFKQPFWTLFAIDVSGGYGSVNGEGFALIRTGLVIKQIF